ncbi:TonB-dependent receptor [Rhabdobacter roseus]|uniref:TonB-linked SusC/RagA family outer membrane protein n=1 Tax=Rhabdobacter roseus TaxID=1655419 RepID=A0A840TQ04_9BACT|nr:SusC/RagA family TonB-linked outer membrane protein [Rhabdobacter roseus]MBB5285881.1 TonB-linked SusC/RagA family outer membrane protein [Rhabdobacter roseus]
MRRFIYFLILNVFTLALARAQEHTITGVVTASSDGQAIPGVNIVVKGTQQGTQTDANGAYTLRLPAASNTLVYTYIGFITKELKVERQTILNVELQADTRQLNELVVTGYSTESRKSFTGSAAKVNAAQLENRPAQSLDQLLGGQAAGVNIVQPSGALNNTPVFRIRGINSITSSVYPLIIIDGVTVFTGSAGGAVGNNPLADINPSDIETIDILKDASATAIYGSRAANGVVVITTKRGKKGSTKVNYDAWVSFSKPFNLLPLLGPEDYVTIKNEARVNAGLSPGFVLGRNADGSTIGTDWYDVAYQTGVSHNHNLSFSGANEQTTYFLALNYSDQNGILKTNAFKRQGARLNLDHRLNKFLALGTTISYSNSLNSGPNSGAIGPNSVAASSGNSVNTQYIGLQPLARLTYILPPNVPIYNADGSYNINTANGNIGYGPNSSALGVFNAYNLQTILDLDKNTSQNNSLLGSIYAEVSLLNNLTFKTLYGINNLVVENQTFRNPYSSEGFPQGGSATNSNTTFFRSNWTNTLAYVNTFGDNHSLRLLLGHEEIYRRVDGWGASRAGLSDPYYSSYQGGWTNITPAANVQAENGLRSFFSTVQYDYRKKYLLSLNVRRDGLSALAAGNKWGNFGGGSLGWNLSEEAFFQNSTLSNTINSLKIRASYGIVGNSSLDDYASLSQYSSSTYAGVPTLNFGQAGNAALRWESSKKVDIGLDIALFNNRLTFVADYYKNTIDGLILSAPQASSQGIPGNAIAANVGSLYNEGIEFSIQAQLINKGAFQWNTQFNLATLKNRVTSLGAGGDIYPTSLSTFGIQNVTRVGYSVGSIFAVPTEGVNPENGNRIYRNRNDELVQYNAVDKRFTYLNGEVAPAIDNFADGRILGSSLPTYYGGWNNTLSYGAFELNVGLIFSGGNLLHNGTRATISDQRYFNNGTFILDRWTTPGQITDVPKLVWGDSFTHGFSSTNSANVEDGSFLKLKNLALNYRIPVQKSGLRQYISGARLYVQAANIFTLTRYRGSDPEISINGNSVNSGKDQNVPVNASVYTLGLNVSF